jgi:hypothetical protein
VKTLETAIEIQASPRRVWTILTDFAAYPGWNPFIPRISGQPAAGARLAVQIRPPGSRGMTFRPTVLAAEPDRELRWRGRLLLPGILDGEHAFLIEPAGDTTVRFVQREVFQGLLVPVLARSLDTGTLEGFRQMNAALKRRAEAG